MAALDPMQVGTWEAAEANAARWMKHWGYQRVTLSQRGADAGVDVRATGAYAQVKFEAHQVGRPALQRLVGARGRDVNADLLFFTGAGYSAHAVEYANEMDIALFRYTLTGDATPMNIAARTIVNRARGRAQAASRQPAAPATRPGPAPAADGSAWSRMRTSWKAAKEQAERAQADKRLEKQNTARVKGTDRRLTAGAAPVASTAPAAPVVPPAPAVTPQPAATARGAQRTDAEAALAAALRAEVARRQLDEANDGPVTPQPATTAPLKTVPRKTAARPSRPVPEPGQSAAAGFLVLFGLACLLLFVVWIPVFLVRYDSPFGHGRGIVVIATFICGVLLFASGMRLHYRAMRRAAQPGGGKVRTGRSR